MKHHVFRIGTTRFAPQSRAREGRQFACQPAWDPWGAAHPRTKPIHVGSSTFPMEPAGHAGPCGTNYVGIGTFYAQSWGACAQGMGDRCREPNRAAHPPPASPPSPIPASCLLNGRRPLCMETTGQWSSSRLRDRLSRSPRSASARRYGATGGANATSLCLRPAVTCDHESRRMRCDCVRRPHRAPCGHFAPPCLFVLWWPESDACRRVGI